MQQEADRMQQEKILAVHTWWSRFIMKACSPLTHSRHHTSASASDSACNNAEHLLQCPQCMHFTVTARVTVTSA